MVNKYKYELDIFKKLNEEFKKNNEEWIKKFFKWEKANKYKKFIDYYRGSYEYRKRHLDYMKQKINCPICGLYTSRAYMTRHRRTTMCKKRADLKLKSAESLLNIPIDKVESCIKKFKKEFKKMNKKNK